MGQNKNRVRCRTANSRECVKKNKGSAAVVPDERPPVVTKARDQPLKEVSPARRSEYLKANILWKETQVSVEASVRSVIELVMGFCNQIRWLFREPGFLIVALCCIAAWVMVYQPQVLTIILNNVR